MAVEDDLRRLSQLDSIYLASGLGVDPSSAVVGWYKGRLQQANDGSWIFRSISTDGTVCGFQLGKVTTNWTSSETPSSGITVNIQIIYQQQNVGGQPITTIPFGGVLLQQQLPQELTN
jgi:hypothetical protein